MAITSSKLNYNQHPILDDKDEDFKALIAEFALELENLSLEQKNKLGLFKAIELTNAVVQTLEKEQAPEALGESKALSLFNIVRSAIRSRYLNLPDATIISLKDNKLKQLIDRACIMFHAGKKDLKQKEKSVAFSMAQNIVLSTEIQQGLEKFCNYYPELHTPKIIKLVQDRYLKPFT
ncbi:hypothetical protein H1P_1310009 [Hyella patelloides LEGE 07179]|uniref:Uncharacterized protein n=1 Tax=Hyella patelloides LEGE 07179 TaxID=945734 RepID=A0A563VKX3_9CYAN|nr:hypothetical protein [Hyella patelloides]VEP12071.1 hypothetical protein H1P_1310009 [Hyella patelloides LEGE 07179]